MRKRVSVAPAAVGVVLAIVLFVPAFLAAQSTGAAKTDVKPAANKTWTVPRTPDGQPDLQGYWTSVGFTPMERPAKYGNREFLTEKETQDIFNEGVRKSFEGSDDGNAITDPNSADYDFKTFGLTPWQEGVRPYNRTSLVVDPPDGRIPPLTPEAKARRAEGYYYRPPAEGENFQGYVHADGPLDLGIRTSCVSMNGGPPIPTGGYNSGLFIVQSANTVVIEAEYGTEVRIIPLDGRPHVGAAIQQWHGDGRGHWEGNTLVVETTNFRPEDAYRNSNPKTLKITEYFTRTAPETIEYKFTIDDPSTWTRPWTAIVPLNAIQGPLPEYDCSEDDFDAVNIMAGARKAEAEAAAKEKAKAPVGVPITEK